MATDQQRTSQRGMTGQFPSRSGTARKDGGVCEHRRMMLVDQFFSPWKILIVSVVIIPVIILVIVVIFISMFGRRSW